MSEIFSPPIKALPLANIPIEGVTAFLSQGDTHQILFMQFEKDVELPSHSPAGQAGFVLNGKIEMTIDGENKIFIKGDSYHIPENVIHSAKIYAGYADITFFDQPDRYSVK